MTATNGDKIPGIFRSELTLWIGIATTLILTLAVIGIEVIMISVFFDHHLVAWIFCFDNNFINDDGFPLVFAVNQPCSDPFFKIFDDLQHLQHRTRFVDRSTVAALLSKIKLKAG